MQKPIFPMLHLAISQGINGNYSHKGTYKIDMCGIDGKIERAFAPCDLVIKAINKKAHAVYVESLAPVKYACGIEDYISFMFIHDNDISDLHVGQIVKQLQYFYDEGTWGNATGNHIDFTCARGKFAGGFYNSYHKWTLKNQIEPYEALFIMPKTQVLKGLYDWVKTDTLTYETKKQYVTYVIQKGDSLSKIAKKYNTTWQKIYELNKVEIGSNPNKIKIGRVLKIKEMK